MTARTMIYADVTTGAVIDQADRYADRRAPLAIGDRFRVDMDTAGTVVAVARDAGGRLVAVTVEADDGTRYRVEAAHAFAVPRTLADSIDAAQAAGHGRV